MKHLLLITCIALLSYNVNAQWGTGLGRGNNGLGTVGTVVVIVAVVSAVVVLVYISCLPPDMKRRHKWSKRQRKLEELKASLFNKIPLYSP